MMKYRLQRLLICTLLASLLLSALPVFAAETGFADVPASSWAAPSIARATELGLFQGETATTFGMGRKMTRAAFTVVLCRFFGWEAQRPQQSTFSDVKNPGAWYYSAVETAYAHGAITRQTEDFRPEEAITREEMAVMLVRALGYGTIAGLVQDLPIPFQDVRTNVGYISMAYELGLVSGTSASTFSPDRTATREQAAVMLMRLYDKLHQAAPGRAGILPAGTAELAPAGYGAVAVSDARLIYNGGPVVTAQLEPEAAAERQTAVRSGGALALLHVTGSANALKDQPAEAAALAQAVEAGGWDGLFLDIPKLKFESRKALTGLAEAVAEQLGDKPLYLVAEAPAWQGVVYDGYDYAALGRAADRLVVRVAPYGVKGSDFSAAPMEPLEEVYYALAEVRSAVPGEKLSLLLTSTGSAWTGRRQEGRISAAEVKALLEKRETSAYYADRYACAYLTYTEKDQEKAVWYLNEAATAERVRMAGFFGVNQVCISDATSVSEELLAGLDAGENA